jgi:hypothetical protein
MLNYLKLLFCLNFLGCSLNTNIERIGATSNINDFLKTEIVVGEPVPADGSSNLLVVIHLKNSDNNPVKEFLPTYTVTANENNDSNSLSNTEVSSSVMASSVLTSPCTTSDNNGISACVLKSTAAGNLIFKLTNAKVGLSKPIAFISVKTQSDLKIVSGSLPNGTTLQGSKVSLTLGEGVESGHHTTSGGYKVKLGVLE